MLGPEFESRVDAIVSRYPQAKSVILPVLWEIQKEKGWVDLDVARWVAKRLDVSEAHVHGVVTFYTMFKQVRSGKYHIQICTTLSCMLGGSDELRSHLEKASSESGPARRPPTASSL